MERSSPLSSCEDRGETMKDHSGGMLPGFRFHPTDQELVDFYLKRKVEKRPAKIDLIKVVDVYKFEPWDLPSVIDQRADKEWYFFCKRGRKYKNSARPNRVTCSGFWKATGIDKMIYANSSITQDCIGLKKSLVYYQGSAGRGSKTDWMMHEFRLPASSNPAIDQEVEVWTLCRIFKREGTYRKYSPPPRKSDSKLSDSDSSSKLSFPGPENQGVYHEFDDTRARDHQTTIADDGLYAGGQFSLDAHISLMENYLGFPSPNDNDHFVDGDCDELRPMVGSALDHATMYS